MLLFDDPSDEMNKSTSSDLFSIKIGGQNTKVLSMFTIREHHICLIIGSDLNEEDEEVFDGHWFGMNDTSFEAVIYHVPTRQEIYRCSLPPVTLSVDCAGDTMATN